MPGGDSARKGLRQYLKDVLTRLPKMTNHQIPEVAPAAWLAEQGRSGGWAKARLQQKAAA